MRRHKSILEFKYAIFDLDGTLIDTMPECSKIFAELLAPYGVPRSKAIDHLYTSHGTPMREQIGWLITHFGHVPPDTRRSECIEQLREQFKKEYALLKAHPLPGTLQIVKKLHNEGKRLFVSTASPTASALHHLRSLGIRERFTLILGNTDVVKGAAHVNIFAETLHLSPEEFASQAFYCGDGGSDMKIATRVGAYPIGVLGTLPAARLEYDGAKRVIQNLGDLLFDT